MRFRQRQKLLDQLNQKYTLKNGKPSRRKWLVRDSYLADELSMQIEVLEKAGLSANASDVEYVAADIAGTLIDLAEGRNALAPESLNRFIPKLTQLIIPDVEAATQSGRDYFSLVVACPDASISNWGGVSVMVGYLIDDCEYGVSIMTGTPPSDVESYRGEGRYTEEFG